MSNRLRSRVQSVASSVSAYAALVCILGGNLASKSYCETCQPSEIWKDMECQGCQNLWEVPNAERTACTAYGAGFVPNLADRSSCIGCPLFQKKSGSRSIGCETDTTMVVAVAGSVLIIFLVSCPLCVQWFRKRRAWLIKRAIAKVRNMHKIAQSFESIHTLDFPMVLLRAEAYLEMQGLTSFEMARERDILVHLDTIADVSNFVSQQKVVFFSHQWLGFRTLDPDNIHYNGMTQALRNITDRGWRLSNVYVWVDYTSIPQKCRSTQKGAISSLPIYASWASVFVILASNAPHKDLVCECNLHTYSKRTWCRVECLSHYCHRGLGDMLVSKDAGFEQVAEDLLQDLLLTFEADCTCCRLKHKDMPCCDKELFVMPVLAMYIRVLLDKDHSMSSRHVHDVVATLKDRMFPKTFTAEFTLDSEELIKHSQSSRPSTLSSLIGKPLQPTPSEIVHIEQQRELFGSLLDDLRSSLPNLSGFRLASCRAEN